MCLLSIIVPIYNVEPYVEKCLRSLEAQDISIDDYEIICINDGSPDNSREVVSRLQKEFNNIILIDQKNQGVSQARNNGTKKANGKYLLFIDPDDLIVANCLSGILKVAVSRKAQIVIPSYSFIDLDENLVDLTTYYGHEKKVLTGIEAYNLTHIKGQLGPDLAVGIIFEADFLTNNSLYFLPNVPFLEDGEFLSRVHCLASRCLITKRQLYKHVVIRSGSATHSDLFDSVRARKGFVLAANNLKDFQRMPSLNVNQKMFLNGSIVQFVLLVVYSALRTRSIKTLKTSINNLKLSGFRKLCLEGCRGWYLICGKPYNFSPYFGALAVAIYLKLDSWHNSQRKKKPHKN